MVIEYRINGTGTWNKIIGIFCNNNTTTGGPLAIDNNNDRVGDGTPLNLSMAEISANIAGVGTTLDLRFAIFANNTAEGAMAIDNFRLFEAIPLPITLVSFDAVKENGTTGLYWTTETESDNIGFDIQRSVDGKTYQTIGSVASKAKNGNSVHSLGYRFQDEAPAKGMNCYRLAEKDKHGRVVYSAVRSLNFNKSADFTCYPNPVQAQLTVKYNSEKEEEVCFRITDAMGKTVLSRRISMQKGLNKTIIDMSALSNGTYSVTVVAKAGRVYTTMVTKY